MLALAGRLEVERAALVRSACACARLALVYAADDDPRVEAAISVAERWADGGAGDEVRASALEAAESASREAAHPAFAASAASAAAALRAIDESDAAIGAAALAVEAAVMDAGDCAMMQALGYMQSRCARAVRESLPFESLEAPG